MNSSDMFYTSVRFPVSLHFICRRIHGVNAIISSSWTVVRVLPVLTLYLMASLQRCRIFDCASPASLSSKSNSSFSCSGSRHSHTWPPWETGTVSKLQWPYTVTVSIHLNLSKWTLSNGWQMDTLTQRILLCCLKMKCIKKGREHVETTETDMSI